ncbi:MAG: hypothetical protein KC733_08790, partial [Candidatus Omnitrophica bacterium]|nr:hypothetical protein [Candidatus Omnitrophota bacterium]
VDEFTNAYGQKEYYEVRGFGLYSKDYLYGAMPFAKLLYSVDTAELIGYEQTISFDPLTRQMTSLRTNLLNGGKKSTVLYDYRYESPVTVSRTDKDGNFWNTTNAYNKDETTIQSITTKNGKTAITATSKYALADKKYHEQTFNWLKHSAESDAADFNKGLIQSKSRSTRSAYGKLIQTETIFKDAINQIYVPERDVSGREIKGKGYKYITDDVIATMIKLALKDAGLSEYTAKHMGEAFVEIRNTHPELLEDMDALKAYAPNLAQVMNLSEDIRHAVTLKYRFVQEYDYRDYQWDKGELVRNRIENLRGDKLVKETISSEGLPSQEIDMEIVLRQNGKIIGKAHREINFIYNGQYPLLAHEGTTNVVITINGKTEKVEFTKSKLTNVDSGRITLVLKDLLRNVVWSEVKDIYQRNRNFESVRDVHKNGKIFTQRILHKFENTFKVEDTGLPINFYDTPDTSRVTNFYPSGKIEEFKSSKAIYYDHETGRLTVEVTNHILNDHFWQEVKNNHNQLIKVIGFIPEIEERIVNTIIWLSYAGLPGLINLAESSATFLTDRNGNVLDEDRPIDRSRLLNAYNKEIDINTVDLRDLFNGKHRVHFQGEQLYYIDENHIARADYQEVRNALGNIEETHTGYIKNVPFFITFEQFLTNEYKGLSTSEDFVKEKSTYRFYEIDELKLGMADVAQKSIKTRVLKGNKEILTAFANNTRREDGRLRYDVKFGFDPIDFELPKDPREVYEYAEKFIEDHERVEFRYPLQAYGEFRNGAGELVEMHTNASGFQANGFATGDYRFKVVFEYPIFGDRRLATNAATYYRGFEGNADEVVKKTTKTGIFEEPLSKRPVAIYDVDIVNPARTEVSERGKVREALSLTGDKVYQDQKATKGPKLIRSYFDMLLPVEAMILEGEVFEALEFPTPHLRFVVTLSESGEIAVIEVPIQEGILDDLQRVFVKNDKILLPAEYRLKYALFKNGNFLLEDDNRDRKYYHDSVSEFEVLGLKFGTKEAKDRRDNSVIGKHIRVFSEETLLQKEKDEINIVIENLNSLEFPLTSNVVFEGVKAVEINSVIQRIKEDDYIYGYTSTQSSITSIILSFGIIAIFFLLANIIKKIRNIGLTASTKQKLNQEKRSEGNRDLTDEETIEILENIVEELGLERQFLSNETFSERGLRRSPVNVNEKYHKAFITLLKSSIKRNGLEENLTDIEKIKVIAEQMKRAIKAKNLVLLGTRDLYWELYSRLVPETFEETIIQILEKLGFDRNAKGQWLFDSFINFRRKDNAFWLKDADVLKEVTKNVLFILIDRIINKYSVSGQEGNSERGLYIKVERPLGFKPESMNYDDWTGWINIPLETVVENAMFKYITGGLTNNVVYYQYLRDLTDRFKAAGREKDIIPEIVMATALFTEILKTEMHNKQLERAARGYEQVVRFFNDEAFTALFERSRKSDGTFVHPFQAIDLRFNDVNNIYHNQLRDTSIDLLTEVRLLINDQTFSFDQLAQANDPISFKHLWAILMAIEKLDKRSRAYVTQDIFSQKIIPFIEPQLDANTTNKVSGEKYRFNYPAVFFRGIKILRLVSKRVIKGYKPAVWSLIWTVGVLVFGQALAKTVIVWFITPAVLILTVSLLKLIPGWLALLDRLASHGKQGLIDFALEELYEASEENMITPAFKESKKMAEDLGDDSRHQTMIDALEFFATYGRPYPVKREVFLVFGSMAVGYTLFVNLGLTMTPLLLAITAFVFFAAFVTQQIASSLRKENDLPSKYKISYTAVGTTIVWTLLGLFGLPHELNIHLVSGIGYIFIFGLSLWMAVLNFILMPKVLFPFAQSHLVARIFESGRRFMVRYNGDIAYWANQTARLVYGQGINSRFNWVQNIFNTGVILSSLIGTIYLMSLTGMKVWASLAGIMGVVYTLG